MILRNKWAGKVFPNCLANAWPSIKSSTVQTHFGPPQRSWEMVACWQTELFPQTVYCWGSILERKEPATLTGRAPELCGWAPWLGSAAGLCGWALSSSCPPLGRAPELCQLCGWALWLGLVLLLAAPLDSVNSVAGLCGWALSSSCPPRGCAPELCQLCGPALCPGLVLLLSLSWPPLNSVAGLCGPALRPHLSKKDRIITRVTQKVFVFSFLSLVCYISIHLPYI